MRRSVLAFLHEGAPKRWDDLSPRRRGLFAPRAPSVVRKLRGLPRAPASIWPARM